MVWSTTQSALYNDLSRYYDDEKSAQNGQEIEPRKFEQNIREKSPENCLEEEPENDRETEPEKCRENREEKEPRHEEPRPGCYSCPGCPNCPNFTNCPHRRNNANDPISRIFSDKDMLLIAGLIFLLSKQGADKKLILALAFVLLS